MTANGESIDLRCACGKVAGTVGPLVSTDCQRLVCYCDDCQAFAHFLGQAGKILDARGGTDILPILPRQLRFTDGMAHVACMSLRPGGLLRWYADCCRTPLANTPGTPSLAYCGVVHRCLVAPPGRDLEDVIGPVRLRVHYRYAKGDGPREPDTRNRAPLSYLVSLAGRLLVARLRGEHRRSPFFDPATRRPVVQPAVLTTAERERVEQARDA